MESWGTWKLIKAGFWIGVGFIIPSIGVSIVGVYLAYSMPSLWRPDTSSATEGEVQQFMADSDKSKQVRIVEYREARNGKQLLVLGTVENTGESSVGSIQIEAELLDGNKKMLYECSEYISRKLKKGESENFQIKCGCGDQPVPEYESLSVRVVQANSF